MLIISNKDVAEVLTMAATIAALERSYANLIASEAVCRPRIDIQIGTLEIRTTLPPRRSDVRRIPARTHSVALDGDR